MKSNNLIKLFKRFAFILLLLGSLVGLTACNTADSPIQGSYDNPYTKAEIEKMLRYHGALVAKFDNGQWYFLSGRRWVKIENGGARQFALNQKTSPLNSSL